MVPPRFFGVGGRFSIDDLLLCTYKADQELLRVVAMAIDEATGGLVLEVIAHQLTRDNVVDGVEKSMQWCSLEDDEVMTVLLSDLHDVTVLPDAEQLAAHDVALWFPESVFCSNCERWAKDDRSDGNVPSL